MKKRMRMTMCLLLVILLVASVSVPAFAATQSGTSTYGQYTYNWSVTRTDTSGSAWIRTPYAPTTVGAAVMNHVYDYTHGISGFNYSTGSSLDNIKPVTGYASATASASNTFTVNSLTHTGLVQQTNGYLFINGTQVYSAVVTD